VLNRGLQSLQQGNFKYAFSPFKHFIFQVLVCCHDLSVEEECVAVVKESAKYVGSKIE